MCDRMQVVRTKYNCMWTDGNFICRGESFTSFVNALFKPWSSTYREPLTVINIKSIVNSSWSKGSYALTKSTQTQEKNHAEFISFSPKIGHFTHSRSFIFIFTNSRRNSEFFTQSRRFSFVFTYSRRKMPYQTIKFICDVTGPIQLACLHINRSVGLSE